MSYVIFQTFITRIYSVIIKECPKPSIYTTTSWTSYKRNYSDAYVKTCAINDPDSFGNHGQRFLKKYQRQAKIIEKNALKNVSSKPLFNGIKSNKVTEDGTVSKRRAYADKEWSDSFGTLDRHEAKISSIEEEIRTEEESEEEKKHISLRAEGRNKAVWYGMQISQLAKKGKVKEAIDLFEIEMLQKDGVMPTSYVFSTLIGAVSRTGDVKKTFSLYEQMKELKVKSVLPVYTSLFNACSKCPSEEGLQLMRYVTEEMMRFQLVPNAKVQGAMVKAYGVLGDIETALQLAKQMIAEGEGRDPRLYCMLLMGCQSNKEEGLYYAIKIWRSMRKRKVIPNLYHYNLLLGVIRKCQIGNASKANNLLRQPARFVEPGSVNHLPSIVSNKENYLEANINEEPLTPEEFTESVTSVQYPKKPLLSISEPLSVTSVDHTGVTEEELKELDVFGEYADLMENEETNQDSHINDKLQFASNGVAISRLDKSDKDIELKQNNVSVMNRYVPNLLNPRPAVAVADIDVEKLRYPWSRLSLLGGLPGFLSHMTQDRVKPDIRTFNQLAEIAPGDLSTEADLLSIMRTHNVSPDINTLNLLLKNRVKAGGLRYAQKFIAAFNCLNVVPNHITYANLALGCNDERDGRRLLKEIEAAQLVPTADICGILLRRSGVNFSYKLKLIQVMDCYHHVPSYSFLKTIEQDIKMAKEALNKKQENQPGKSSENFHADFKKFMFHYKKWLLKTNIDHSDS